MSKSSPNSRRQILGVIPAVRAEQMLAEWVNTDLPGIPEDANAWERLFRRYPEIPSVATEGIIPVNEANFDRFHQQMEMADAVAEYLRKAWDAPDLRYFEWYTWKAQTEYEWEAIAAKHNRANFFVDTGEKVVEYSLKSESLSDLQRYITKILNPAKVRFDTSQNPKAQTIYSDNERIGTIFQLPLSVHMTVQNRHEQLQRELTSSHITPDKDDLSAFTAALLDFEDPPPTITSIEAAIFYLRHTRNRALHCPNPECPAPYFFASKKGQKYCSPECAKPSQRESKRQWWATNRAKKRTT